MQRAEANVACGKLFQSRHGGGIGVLDEQALRSVPPPAVRVGERFHEGGRGCPSERRTRAGRGAFMNDAKDAPEMQRLRQSALRDLIAQI